MGVQPFLKEKSPTLHIPEEFLEALDCSASIFTSGNHGYIGPFPLCELNPLQQMLKLEIGRWHRIPNEYPVGRAF